MMHDARGDLRTLAADASRHLRAAWDELDRRGVLSDLLDPASAATAAHLREARREAARLHDELDRRPDLRRVRKRVPRALGSLRAARRRLEERGELSSPRLKRLLRRAWNTLARLPGGTGESAPAGGFPPHPPSV